MRQASRQPARWPTWLPALGLDTWRSTWLRLTHDVVLNGRVTALCGSLLPSQVEALPGRTLIGPIRFRTLDCPMPSSPEGSTAAPPVRGLTGATGHSAGRITGRSRAVSGR